MNADINSPCGVCGAPVTVPYLDNVRDYQFGGIHWTGAIKGCSACGLLQQSPMPTREQALALYPENYTHYNFQPSNFRTMLMKLYFRDLIALLKKLGQKSGDKLLDIGCASGEKAAFLRDSLKLDVTGLEPNAQAAERAQTVFGVKTINDFFPTREIAPNTFDFIYFNHVIEHVPEPVRLLNAIAEALKPGGWLIGETENITAPSARIFGRYWSLCHLPFHLYFFFAANSAQYVRGLGHEDSPDRPDVGPVSRRHLAAKHDAPEQDPRRNQEYARAGIHDLDAAHGTACVPGNPQWAGSALLGPEAGVTRSRRELADSGQYNRFPAIMPSCRDHYHERNGGGARRETPLQGS